MANEKLLKQIANLEQIAEKNGWEFYYDSELDMLYFIPEKLSDDARLFAVGNEFNLYLTPQLEVQGVFMEYFRANYVKHEREFKDIPKLFTKPEDGLKTVPYKQKNKLKAFKNTLKAEILSELVESNKSPVIIP